MPKRCPLHGKLIGPAPATNCPECRSAIDRTIEVDTNDYPYCTTALCPHASQASTKGAHKHIYFGTDSRYPGRTNAAQTHIFYVGINNTPPDFCSWCGVYPKSNLNTWDGPYRLIHADRVTFPATEPDRAPANAWLHKPCNRWTVKENSDSACAEEADAGATEDDNKAG